MLLPLVQIDGGVHRVAMSVSKPRVGESLSEKFQLEILVSKLMFPFQQSLVFLCASKLKHLQLH